MSRRTALLLLLAILVVGVGLRIWQVTARSLWFDEAFSWRLIQFPFLEMITRAQADVHPVLYYIVLKGWSVVFGSSLASLRGFSIAAGAATIALGYLFTSYAFRQRTTGLLAAAALALAGFQIQYAWEARMYTLGTALALLSAWLLLHAIRARRHQLLWWLGYGVAAGAFAHVHYYTLLSIVSFTVFLLGYLVVSTKGRIGEILQWRLSWYALAAHGVIALLFLPWLPTFIQQNAQVQQAFWIPEINRWSMPDTFYRFLVPVVGFPSHDGVLSILITLLPLVGIVVVWMLMLASTAKQRTQDAAWLTVTLGAFPFVLSLVASLLGRSVYQDRYFAFAHVFVLAALAALVMRLPWRTIRWGLATLLLLAFGVTYVTYWQELDIKHKPGARAAATALYSARQPEEPVLVSSPFVFFAIDYYAKEELKEDPPKLFSPSGQLAHFAGGPILTTADIAGEEFFDPQIRSFWVVDTTGFGGTPLEVPSPWKADTTARFAEVFGYQGEVLITRYLKVSN